MKVVQLIRGTAPSWIRIVITGPADHPIIDLGGLSVGLNTSIPAGKSVEINSYPTSRRIVNSDGLSLAAYLDGTVTLDMLKLPVNVPIEISWTATNMDANSNMTLFWRDAY